HEASPLADPGGDRCEEPGDVPDEGVLDPVADVVEEVTDGVPQAASPRLVTGGVDPTADVLGPFAVLRLEVADPLLDLGDGIEGELPLVVQTGELSALLPAPLPLVLPRLVGLLGVLGHGQSRAGVAQVLVQHHAAGLEVRELLPPVADRVP